MTTNDLTRRAFLATTTLSAVSTACAARVNTARVVPGKISPNEKLNIAGIGIGGMGFSNLRACSTENIVALCDVDQVRAQEPYALFPNAKQYVDYRALFDAEGKNIELELMIPT